MKLITYLQYKSLEGKKETHVWLAHLRHFNLAVYEMPAETTMNNVAKNKNRS